jgi:hypothetical protein
MSRDNLEWIELRDFSPGIVQHLGWGRDATGPAPGGRDGAARMEGTHRCIALPAGGLGPLPRRDYTLTKAESDPADDLFYYTTAIVAQGPILKDANSVVDPMNRGWRPEDPRDPDSHNLDIHWSTEWISTTDGFRKSVWRRTKLYEAGSPTVDLVSETGTVVPRDVIGGAWLCRQRINGWQIPPDNTDPGVPAVIWSTRDPDLALGADFDRTDVFPRLGILAELRGPVDTFNILIWGGGPVFPHQGRVVHLNRVIQPQGSGGDEFSHNETLEYTKVNSAFREDLSLFGVVYGPEEPAGYGAWGSASASDLMLVRHTGGGYLIQGDLNSPIVRRFPGLVGTGGIEQNAAITAVGLVYAVNRGGVYAWGGGDFSEPLAPQLSDDFWYPDEADRIALYKGGFLQWHEWVVAPNNWLYDPARKSWWRLEDPATVQLYNYAINAVTGRMYAIRPRYKTGEAWLHGFDRGAGALTWEWTSQPLWKTAQRLVNVQEVWLVCQGQGQIRVDVVGSDGTPEQRTFTLTGSVTRPQVIRQRFNTKATDIQVSFHADSLHATAPAPVLYEARIGYREAQTTARG